MTEAAYSGTHVQLELPVLESGTRATFAPPEGQEGAVVLLAGDVEWCGARATRDDVFATRAHAAFVPAGSAIEVDARARSELAFATTVGYRLPAAASEPVLVGPDDVVARDRGAPGWQRRVHDVVADNVSVAQRLIVGETFNEPGQWSSFPPHKHDGADGEPALEEVYYYRFDRPEGFGFQALYDADGRDRAILLRHGTVVGIPRGYHPVCAAPGYRLYYLWALAGAERRLAMHEDPAHRWLNVAAASS